jgi:hypothetical protein
VAVVLLRRRHRLGELVRRAPAGVQLARAPQFSTTPYEKWLGGVTQFFLDKGYLSEDELASRQEELVAEKVSPAEPDRDDRPISVTS